MTLPRSPLTPEVTDHAVLRYIERAHGVDVGAIRQHIAGLVARGVEREGDAVIAEGVKFVLRGRFVVSVLKRQWPLTKPERRDA